MCIEPTSHRRFIPLRQLLARRVLAAPGARSVSFVDEFAVRPSCVTHGLGMLIGAFTCSCQRWRPGCAALRPSAWYGTARPARGLRTSAPLAGQPPINFTCHATGSQHVAKPHVGARVLGACSVGTRKGMAIQAVIEQYQLGKESCILFFDDDPAYLQGAIEYFNRVNLTQVLVAGSARPPLSK